MQSIRVPNSGKGCILLFKKFSRKNYAAFSSMHKVVHIATLALAYSIIVGPLKICAQSDTLMFSKTIDLEEVEIIGEKNPVPFMELPRVIAIIAQDETESAPSQSITDILQYTSTIDIRQRGRIGIQSDVSIRGSSFDHNLIMLNGINLSDPQTGHLSLNLPVETDAIKQVEIISGPATRQFGTNAFAGVVNFITSPLDENYLKIAASAGCHQTFGGSVTINLASNKSRNLLHYNNGITNGHTTNTDFSKQAFFYQGQFFTGEGQFEIQFGYNTRSFGANGYYTPKYPDQFEENQMSLFSLSYKTGELFKVNSSVYWRRHKDRFELFREGNDWYSLDGDMAISNDTNKTQYDTVPWYSRHNHHINDAIGAKLSISRSTRIGVTTLEWHIRNENIISTNIGYDKGIVVPVNGYENVFYSKSDNRTIFDLHLEQTVNIKSLYIAAGILLNWNTFLPDEISLFPGIDLRYDVAHFLQLMGSYNYSLGLPTFTDLTYEDPSNEGNNQLKPYTKQSVEGGLQFLYGSNITSMHAFYEFGEEIIDWVWFTDDNRFKPVNVDDYRNEGIEISSQQSFIPVNNFPFALRKIRISYIFMNMHKEIPGEVAKYFNLRHKLTGMVQQQIIKNLILSWNFGYHEREGSYLTYDFSGNDYLAIDFKPYWIFDIRASYSWKGLTAFVEATNLFNNKYIDIGSIIQPGRWITGGLKYELRGF